MKCSWARIPALVGIAALIAGAALAEDKPVTLSRTHKVGDVIKHKAVITAMVMGNDVTLTETQKTVVKQIKENGNVVFVNTVENAKLTVGGMDMDLPEAGAETVTLDKSGKLMDFAREEIGMPVFTLEIDKLMAILREPAFPGKEVKAGDSWETEQDNPAAKGKKVTLKTTFAGIDKVDGVDTWKIKQTGEAAVDADGNKTSYEATFWLDPANGRLVKGEASAKDIPSNYGPLTMTVKITLDKEEKKADK